jgi:hypothetical protein
MTSDEQTTEAREKKLKAASSGDAAAGQAAPKQPPKPAGPAQSDGPVSKFFNAVGTVLNNLAAAFGLNMLPMNSVMATDDPPITKDDVRTLDTIAKVADVADTASNLVSGDQGGKMVVDPHGNTVPLKNGETTTGSPDGKYLQVRGADGQPTGLRIDGPHKDATHSDPRALVPHAHVPGVTNPDGTPWLPIKGIEKANE